jgi:two-component system chemotaxis response regulator CheY
MDGMDGIECTKRIRRGLPGVNAHLPIILLTGSEEEGTREQAETAGVSLYLTKPFSYKGIKETFEELFAPKLASAVD